MSQPKQSVDLRGLTCPEPVIRTKKLFDNTETTVVEALVDDDVCVNNLQRLARSLKAEFNAIDKGGYYAVTLQRGGCEQTQLHTHQSVQQTNKVADDTGLKVGTVIFIGKDKFGDGDEEFSKTLLNLFLQTIRESGHKPRAILMANSGVKLMAAESQALKVLNDFKSDGCEVLACGLCVDYYKLKEQIPKEQITNMFAICEYLFAADNVLQP